MQRYQLLIFGVLLGLYSCLSSGYEFCEERVAERCIEGAETRVVDGFDVYRSCWKYQTDYECYSEPVTNDCSDEESAYLRAELREIFEMSPGNELVSWSESKAVPFDCEFDESFGCSNWYVTEDGFDAKTCYVGEKKTCEEEGCKVFTQECTQFSNGICSQELVSYSCAGDETCSGDVGLAVRDENGGSFDKAVAAANIADLVASEGIIDEETGELRLFEGKQRGCKYISQEWEKAVGFTGTAASVLATIYGGWGGALATAPVSTYTAAVLSGKMDCCDNDPDEIDVNGSLTYCSEDNVELAIARMTKRTVELGGKRKVGCFCSDFTGLLVQIPLESGSGSISDCDELCGNPYRALLGVDEPMDWKKEYCVFDSMLGRIIQEEGRQQIEEILNSTQSTDRESFTLSSNYYDEEAGWSDVISVAGNDVSYWVWDSACNSEEGRGRFLKGELSCPMAPSLYMAACSNEDGCGDLPIAPFLSESGWSIKNVRANDPSNTFTVSKYLQVRGECYLDNTCDWTVIGWPGGLGSSIVQRTNLVWQRKFPTEGGTGTSWDVFKGGTNSLLIEMLTTIDQTDEPVEPKIRVSRPGTGVWEEFELESPIEDPDFFVTLSDMSKLYISGSCGRYLCEYEVGTTVSLALKPWYENIDKGREEYCLQRLPFVGCVDEKRVNRPDDRKGYCEGFTLDEFLTLDLSRMDLSEYTDHLSERAKAALMELISEDE
jgi:hypothetical protein